MAFVGAKIDVLLMVDKVFTFLWIQIMQWSSMNPSEIAFAANSE